MPGRFRSSHRGARPAGVKTDLGRELYVKRRHSIEPVFGHTKYNRAMSRFRRRGRASVRSERRLIATTHNLLKLHNRWIQPVTD